MTSPADNQPGSAGGAKDGPAPYSAEAADAQMLRIPIISVAITGIVLRNNPAIAMNTALLVYVVQMAVMFGLILILQDATFFNPKAFALTIVACALVWTIAMVLTMTRTKVLYVEPGSGPGKTP